MRYHFITLLGCLAAHCSYAFNGVGDCDKLLTDYAQLTNKSVFLPKMLSGSCVIQSEKDFPLIMHNAGFIFKDRKGVVSLDPIVPKEKKEILWVASPKKYDVSFAFVNVSSAIDCGLTLNDVLFSFHNLDYHFSIGGSLGCPALDNDGSFSFSVNANLTDSWSYTHGLETSRAESEITSATGAVTTSYKWITTGLSITLNQREDGTHYSLRYTSKNGSVSTASGLITDLVQADISETIKTRRKLWFIPLGWIDSEAKYKLILKISEVK